DAALGPDVLEVSDQQRPEVDPRSQRRTTVPGRIELPAAALDKLVETLRLQQLVQPLIKRIPRRRRQLRVRDPQILLLLPLPARPHRHAPILQTHPVHTRILLTYESALAPRAVRPSEAPSFESSWTSTSAISERDQASGLKISTGVPSPLVSACAAMSA